MITMMKCKNAFFLVIISCVLSACFPNGQSADPGTGVDIQVLEGPGGAKVWLVEDHTVPVVAVEMRFVGGSIEDPDAQVGRAALMAAMLREGAGDLDDQAFAIALENQQMSLSTYATKDAVGVSSRMLSRNLLDSFRLMYLAVSNPRFDHEALTRIRDQALQGLKERESEPSWLAKRSLMDRVLPDSVYARDIARQSLLNIHKEDLVKAYQQHIGLERLQITVVGDVTKYQVANLLDVTFANLPAGQPLPDAPTINVAPANTVLKTILPQPQTRLAFIAPGIGPDHDDFFPMVVASHILGSGDFSSRLMKHLRVEKGLTYGVNLGLYTHRNGGMMMGGGSTQNATASQALSEFRYVLNDVAKNGFTADELHEAKRYLTGSYVLGFDGNAAIASRLAGYRLYDRPVDYVNMRNDHINAVTLDDINRVAKIYLSPDAFTVAAVGIPHQVANNQTFAPVGQ